MHSGERYRTSGPLFLLPNEILRFLSEIKSILPLVVTSEDKIFIFPVYKNGLFTNSQHTLLPKKG